MGQMSDGLRSRDARVKQAVAALALAFPLALVLPARGREQGGAVKPAPSSSVLLEVTDETGRRVKVPQPVRRIVSLAPSLTETLYALGAQDRVVGVTDSCDYPPEARSKPRVGGPMNPSLEQVVALKPDLVVMAKTANRLETVEALERLSMPVYGTDSHSVEDVLASTERLAGLIGVHEEGAALVASLRARLDQLQRALADHPPRRVLFVVWLDPLISAGPGSFVGDALRRAGAETVIRSRQDWPHVSLEEVVRLQPEYLVFANSDPEQASRDFQTLDQKPGWRILEAVRERRIATISDAVNRPAPRLIDAIEQLARQLHPDAFPERPGTKSKAPPPHGFEAVKRVEEACACVR
jgi:iron complex transport system substrate-binding protein